MVRSVRHGILEQGVTMQSPSIRLAAMPTQLTAQSTALHSEGGGRARSSSLRSFSGKSKKGQSRMRSDGASVQETVGAVEVL